MTGVFGRANRSIPQDVHGQIAQDERLDLATRLPVQVKEVDYGKQTTTLRVLYKPTFGGKEVDFPDILEAPIQQARGGGFAVTLPVKAGDYGFVEFGARDLDNWWETGEAKPAASQRYHSFSDGIFVPGANPSTNVMSNYDSANAFFGTDDHANGFRVTPNGTVAIEGSGESLLQIIDDALQELITSQDVEGPGFTPGVRAALTAIQSRLRTMKFR